MTDVMEQQTAQLCNNQVHVVLGQRMLRFLPTTADVVRCGMVCRDWHAAMALLPSEVAIDVLTARQGLGMLWLEQNINRVLNLRLDLPSEWPSKTRAYMRRRYTANVCEEACEVLSGAKHLQTLAYQLPMIPDPVALAQLSNLQHLTLQQVNGRTVLPQDLGQLSKLQVLTIQDCNQLQQLPESFGSLTALQKLTIVYCELLEQLPSALGDLIALQQLHLVGCSGLSGLPDSIGNLINLTQLEMKPQSDTISRRWIQESRFTVPGGLWRLPALLDLHINKCPDDPVSFWADIPKVVWGLQRLEQLHLEAAATADPSVFQAVSQLTALTALSINSDRSGDPAATVPREICYLPNLQQLHIHGCLVEQLPEDLGRLPSLKQLTLQGMVELLALPASLGCLSKLQSLALINLRYVPELPDNIGDLASLQTLEIDGCWSMKRLPESIGRLTALQKLAVHHAGLLPASTTALTRLTALTFGEQVCTVADGVAVCVAAGDSPPCPTVGQQLTLTEIVEMDQSWKQWQQSADDVADNPAE